MPNGLTDMQRLAIACGNADYGDDMVCQNCNGEGSTDSGTSLCAVCGGEGHVPRFTNIPKSQPRVSKTEDFV